MKISDLLHEDMVIGELHGTTKQQVLEEMVKCLSVRTPKIDTADLLKVLIDREKLGSTGIGNGIAIPHGKIDGLNEIYLVFGRSKHGIPFDALDNKPVHLIFLLVAPANSAGTHLKALARLSRLLKDKHFRDLLLEIPDEHGLYQAIITEDEKIIV
ncbi:MAG: PTS sugar transporter subunit IIA [Desulfobacterota bacterium]|nr:PTS sugar transporter subunit IIA [Thermodesulfobacteriota bacterium]